MGQRNDGYFGVGLAHLENAVNKVDPPATTFTFRKTFVDKNVEKSSGNRLQMISRLRHSSCSFIRSGKTHQSRVS
jgi:hypothetical protein